VNKISKILYLKSSFQQQNYIKNPKFSRYQKRYFFILPHYDVFGYIKKERIKKSPLQDFVGLNCNLFKDLVFTNHAAFLKKLKIIVFVDVSNYRNRNIELKTVLYFM
jgi:hypothetical protein